MWQQDVLLHWVYVPVVQRSWGLFATHHERWCVIETTLLLPLYGLSLRISSTMFAHVLSNTVRQKNAALCLRSFAISDIQKGTGDPLRTSVCTKTPLIWSFFIENVMAFHMLSIVGVFPLCYYIFVPACKSWFIPNAGRRSKQHVLH